MVNASKIHATVQEDGKMCATSSDWPTAAELEGLMGEREMAQLSLLLGVRGEGVLDMARVLGCDPGLGLECDLDDLDARKAHFGKNSFDAKPPTTYFHLWWSAMHDGAIIVLSIMVPKHAARRPYSNRLQRKRARERKLCVRNKARERASLCLSFAALREPPRSLSACFPA